MAVGERRATPRFRIAGALRASPWLGLAALCVAALAPGAGPAQARECTWGQPGYRDCVDGEIVRRSQRAKSGERTIYRTAPARRRPGTLTPTEPVPGPEPTRVAPKRV